MINRLKGLAATLILAAILVGLPAALAAVGLPALFTQPVGNPLEVLLRPDDGTLVLSALWVIGCVVWVVLAVATLTELVSALRRVRAPQLAGLRLPQAFAQQLVSTAALLFVATSSLAPTAQAAPLTTTATVSVAPEADPLPVVSSLHATPPASPTAATYVVQPGDSLWRIAEQKLGAGERYPEIISLNADLLGNGPDFLKPGWRLQLPAAAAPLSATGDELTVTVAKGDTLSRIAETHLGDPSRWVDIYDASTAIVQPDGRRLTDPDQIDIGWTLTIPAGHDASQDIADQAAPEPRTEPDISPDASEPAPPHQAPAEPPPAERPAPAPADAGPTAAPEVSTADLDAHEDPAPSAPWLVPGLSAGGLLLGAFALVLTRRRAAQARFRRPGKAIPAAPVELAPIEKTVATSPAAAVTVQTLDRILRWTAAQQFAAGDPVPPVIAVDFDAERVTLHLAEEATLRAPWLTDATGKHWTLRLSEVPDQDALAAESGAAAWPQLVTLGTNEAGVTWLLNTEEVGTIRLTGDPTYAQDFTRYLVAELALNPWAQDVRIDCINTCAELVNLDPSRVRHHTDRTAVADALAEAVNTVDRLATLGVPDLADARTGEAGDDLWCSRAVLVTEPHAGDLDVLMDTIATQVGRTGTSVVLTQPTGTEHGMEIHFTETGRVQLPSAGLDLIAVGLTRDEAAGCAALIAIADLPDDADIPPMETITGQNTWRSYANEAGQITDSRITERSVDAQRSQSILPEDDETLLAVSAVTEEDLTTLAPTIPTDVAAEVESIDPTLDDDLAEWDAGGARPRLSVLGPVVARTGSGGNAQAVVRRKPYYTELLAYLASRPNGATTDQVAAAMNIDTKRVRRDLSILRDWLGIDAATGQPHIPEATKSNAAKLLGCGAYEVNGLLYDADLFRRLRVRGEARGAEGLPDLTKALALVNGRPFDEVRSGGGSWLVDQSLPHYLTVAVVDVAHLVTTISLARGNHRVARAATETAILAAPHEQIPRLDLAAVAAAEGLSSEAKLIAQTTLDGDGDEPPLEVSRRAGEIVARHRWLVDDAQAS